MNSDVAVMPAVMPRTADDLRAAVFALSSFAPLVHVDVMDGSFVAHVSWPYSSDGFEEIPLPSPGFYASIAVHLMVQMPQEIGVAFARAGVPCITVQFEAFMNLQDAKDALHAIRAAGTAQVGIAVLLDTPLSAYAPLVDDCDFFQVMSIARIGFQGEPFDIRAIALVRELHAAYPNKFICVDGGVSKDNIARLAAVGATRFAVGSAITRAPDPLSAYGELIAALGGVQ